MQDIQQDENAHCTCVSEKDFFLSTEYPVYM